MSLGGNVAAEKRESGSEEESAGSGDGANVGTPTGDGESSGDADAVEATAGGGDTAAGGDDGDEDVGANELLELLGNRRRRLLWRHLRTEEAEAALSDASRRIAAWENDVDPGDVEYDQRKSVYTSLRQFHCPKMADAGLIEFDDRDGTVRLTSDLPDELVIEIEPDTENIRRTALGALTLSTGAIFGSWAVGLPVFGPLSFGGVVFAVAAAVVAAGLVYGVAVRSDHGVSLGDALARVDG
ncbi:hypothetical protein EKH57_08415 [Halorubrum sp. BOL3-1]|uniref:DUF7344 domain-containing protein n=1 Tax=Halorubrum sp. BOL3-1 TaxID=2497325 RepID=UPI001004E62D|nr:hypothetical protein [Halorubrum sp. BOL3-1]QAU12743.1 hypothetical protein EKH57_08415 [Halorubrum sp. BOL3-1]